MAEKETIQHVQQTFLSLADEFLIQYFLCADRRFMASQILSRLFSMGHSLELYLKAALISEVGIPPFGHEIPSLIDQFDPSLALSQEEIAAGMALFGPGVTNFDLGIHLKHQEALELYQAQYFLTDLKYYIAKNGKIAYPVRTSLKTVNWRYLAIVKCVRSSIEHRTPEQDRLLVGLVDQLGFESNPALKVISQGSVSAI